MTQVTGQRLPDTDAGHLAEGWQPGDFWKVLTADGSRPVTPQEYSGTGHDYSGNLTGEVWFVVTPLGQLAGLSLHTAISIRPGDGSSNSVLVEGPKGRTWHGYIEHGVWSEC